MAEILHAYPSDPTPAIRTVIDYFTTGNIPPIEVGHALWHAAGYGLSQVDPHHPVIKTGESLKDLSDADLSRQVKSVCEAYLAVEESGVKTAVDWVLLIKLFLELAGRLLDSLGK